MASRAAGGYAICVTGSCARFFVVMDERSVGRILKTLTFSHISVACPRHPQADAEAQEIAQNNFADLVAAVIP